MIISGTDRSTLDALLNCSRNGCKGIVGPAYKGTGISLRTARALIEYGLRQDSSFRLGGECYDCGGNNWYTYSDIINLIPEHLRPQQLPDGQLDALILIRAGELPNGEECFFGERVIVQILDESEGVWIGRLLTTSTFTPTLQPGVDVVGYMLGAFRVCDALCDGTTTLPLPVLMPGPGTTDHGLFLIEPSNPDVLESTQPFCSNPSCCHIMGWNYKQFVQEAESHKDEAWFWKVTLHLTVNCERCGTSTVIDSSSYDVLRKI